MSTSDVAVEPPSTNDPRQTVQPTIDAGLNEMQTLTETGILSDQDDRGRPKRIGKDEMCLLMAWWMEYSPWAHKSEDLNKMGVVIMRQKGTMLAVDCTRKDNVHPIQYLLAKHQEASEGSDLYLSRPPCANCTKSIVQAKVRKVYHLPFKPELEAKDDRVSTAKLFSVNSVGVSVMVPNVSDETYERSKGTKLFGPDREQSDIFQEYQVDEWFFSTDSKYAMDQNRLDAMKLNLVKAKRFLLLKTIQQVGDDIQFRSVKNKNGSTILAANCKDPKLVKKYKLALHSSRMANLLASRTDDPKTGVGVVLLKPHQEDPEILDLFEYVGVGWNGYPMGARFEDYPRRSEKSGLSPSQQKYDFIIHAEYNAALFRNTSKLAGCYSYGTRKPCDACFPLWEKFRIKEAYYPVKRDLPYITKEEELRMDSYEAETPR